MKDPIMKLHDIFDGDIERVMYISGEVDGACFSGLEELEAEFYSEVAEKLRAPRKSGHTGSKRASSPFDEISDRVAAEIRANLGEEEVPADWADRYVREWAEERWRCLAKARAFSSR